MPEKGGGGGGINTARGIIQHRVELDYAIGIEGGVSGLCRGVGSGSRPNDIEAAVGTVGFGDLRVRSEGKCGLQLASKVIRGHGNEPDLHAP
ncbi:unnamed protein product [Prunus armeniaca]|uniref:Uncharacterized protein n=1 Tax=Prunus armeniaca TaxID=36596 RepID=A0A6J5VC35_PRUAR|nr:unnamed protein product [Prunus armeniaca]